MKKLNSAWIKASRPTLQSYVFLPILLGQALYYFEYGKINWVIFICLHLFGLFDQLYIVFANDYADQVIDRRNKTFNLFSGGSRVLIDGDLTPDQLRRAAWIMFGLCLTVGLVLTVFYQRWLALPMILFALALLWVFSFPPFKLSYRGGGEIVQMIGIGLVLPVLAYYAQAGNFKLFNWDLILMLLPAQLACAMSTSLPDEPSDKIAGKRTAAVWLTPIVTKGIVVLLSLMTVGLVYRHTNLGIDSIKLGWLILIPLISSLGHLFYIYSREGTRGLIIFNFLSVFTVLSMQLELAIGFFMG